MSDPVIQAAQVAFRLRIQDNNDVSANTKNAQAIAETWCSLVHDLDPDRYLIQARVTPGWDQKVDVIDTAAGTAYEFKVSGKNATAELCREVVKVISWNEKRKSKLSRLVFITDGDDAQTFIDAPMPRAYIEYLKGHGLEVVVAYVHREEA